MLLQSGAPPMTPTGRASGHFSYLRLISEYIHRTFETVLLPSCLANVFGLVLLILVHFLLSGTEEQRLWEGNKFCRMELLFHPPPEHPKISEGIKWVLPMSFVSYKLAKR